MDDQVIEILVDMSNFPSEELEALGEAGGAAATSIGLLTSSSETGTASLGALTTQVRSAAASLGEGAGIDTSGLAAAADKAVASISKSASSALSTALKDIVIDGDSFSEAVSTLSSKLASSALTTVSGKMFDTLLSSLLGGSSGSSASSGWLSSLFGFAEGGVMTSAGPVALRAYAGGGVADEPQLALFGEGAMPEAYVPLPDGRSIPVTMQGGGGRPSVTIQMSVAAQDAASFRRSEGQIGATVAAKLQRYMQRYG